MRLRTLCSFVFAIGLASAGSWARADLVTDVHALIAKGELAAALSATDKVLSERPRDAQARFLRALVLMDQQRNSEALAAFTELTHEYPELPEPFNNIALLQVRAGQLELARQALEAALRNDPSHRTARLNLGEVYLMLAVQAWERAAASGALDSRTARKLESARALVGAAALAGR
jgi:tetratricopeptide (TPR) repeat protein